MYLTPAVGDFGGKNLLNCRIFVISHLFEQRYIISYTKILASYCYYRKLTKNRQMREISYVSQPMTC